MTLIRKVGLALAVLVLAACSSADGNGGADPGHTLVATDQMTELAEQQCLDDPTKQQGVIRAVDPNSDPGTDGESVFAEVVVECDTVR